MIPNNDSRSSEWVKKKFIDNNYPDDFSEEEMLDKDHIIKHSSQLKVDVEKGWNTVYNGITVPRLTVSKPNTNRYLMRLAAAITLLIVAAIVVFNLTEPVSTDLVYESGTSSQLIKLKDGSSVKLNKNSKLIVDKNYNINSRQITLKGEALFSVKKDLNEVSFTVKTDHGLVTVLGTEFNVKTDQVTQVYVKHGKVALTDKSAVNSIQLTKGQLGTADKSGQLSKTIGNDNVLFWHSSILSFESVKLIDITNEVNKRLGTNIKPDQNIAASVLTLSFEGKSVEDFFEELKRVKAVKITQEANGYRISDLK